MSNPSERAGARRATARRRHRSQPTRIRRRRLIALGAAAMLAFVVGASLGGDDEDAAESEGSRAAAARTELPRGGHDLLPRHTLVGFYGAPQDEELGALGIGPPSAAAARLVGQARAYEGKRPVLPVLELLASIATSEAGADGNHRLLQPHSVIERYLAEARRRHGLLLLDIQPGRADFRDEVDRLARWLREPDVGLALDPEWHVGPGDVPGQVIGSVEAATVNEISRRLSRIIRHHDLPEKLFVVHQFTRDMISNRGRLRDRPGLAIVLNSDGFGDPANKIAKYDELRPGRETPFFPGFKLFYGEDVDLMSADEVLALRPPPKLIVYE